MADKKILIISGEPSGDMHAANLVRDLNALNGHLKFFGMGGSLSKKAGVEIVFDITKLALVGAIEVLKNIFTVNKAFQTILSKVGAEKPDIAILVDYPGFNLRMAKELKKRSIPVIYYISPQVWAWGRDRVKLIKRCVRKMVVFFKFEEELYKTYDIDAEFVGHPLLDTVKTTLSKEEVFEKYGLDKNKSTIALLPGSRRMEVGNFLSTIVSSAKIISSRVENIQFVVAKHPDLPNELYEDAVKDSNLNIKIINNDTYNVVGASDLAIVASGTATLETAIIGTPLVIVYKVNLITYILYKIVSDTNFIGLVNIIAGKEVAPELLQYDATAQNIADTAMSILGDEKRLAAIKEDLKNVKLSLGQPGACKRAASSILPLLK